MARKPLIEPGSLLPAGGLQAEIIKSDREKSGRVAPGDITSNITAQEDSQAVISAGSQEGIREDAKPTAREYAKVLSESDAMPITLRLPVKLNDYLDEVAHQYRKRKVKKQDLVALAARLLVERLESGDDLLELLKGD